MWRPLALACGRRSSTTCEASSRVGTRISAPGRLPLGAVRSTTGIPKARVLPDPVGDAARMSTPARASSSRSEEHTSELQSRQYLVCRLLLEKKKNTIQGDAKQKKKK